MMLVSGRVEEGETEWTTFPENKTNYFTLVVAASWPNG